MQQGFHEETMAYNPSAVLVCCSSIVLEQMRLMRHFIEHVLLNAIKPGELNSTA
jgi:predicted metal-dependent peptidase